MDKEREYLGDGIYVAFNGYSYEISVNDHKNDPVVVFEPSHINNFRRFQEKMIQKHKTKINKP